MENPMDEWTEAIKKEQALANEVAMAEYAIVMEAVGLCARHPKDPILQRMFALVLARFNATMAHLEQMPKTTDAMREARIAFQGEMADVH